MREIGKQIGEVYASPALAYLWDYAERNPYRPRAWSVSAVGPSPVVIDLIAEADMIQSKSSGGYVLRGASVEWTPQPVRTGRARFVLYNFGTEEITGRLEIAEPSPVTSTWDAVVTLAPGERRELPAAFAVSGETRMRRTVQVRFLPQTRSIAPAVFSTALYPSTFGMKATPVADFDFPEDSRRRDQLQARPVATGESRLQRDGRWLVTDGVTVEEQANGVWRFRIDYLPAEPLRPAVVELPLPRGFTFKSGTLLSLERRKVAVADEAAEDVAERRSRFVGAGREGASGAPDPSRFLSRAGKAGDRMDVYFRTEQGNLYQTWPRLRVTSDWEQYWESADNFTMGFFGRAERPWRFADNTPVALVFFLRPAELPAIFEVRDARIVEMGTGR